MSAPKRRKPTATEPCLALPHKHERSRHTDQTVRRCQLSGQRHRLAERRHDMRVRQQTFERRLEFLCGGRAWKIRLRQHHLIHQALLVVRQTLDDPCRASSQEPGPQGGMDADRSARMRKSAKAVAAAGLCAPSSKIVGWRSTTSNRPAQLTARKPARTASGVTAIP